VTALVTNFHSSSCIAGAKISSRNLPILAVYGGAAGGPNGIYKDPYGFNGNNAHKAMVQRKQR
jgi:hypothetical protein